MESLKTTEVDESSCPKCNYSTYIGETINCDSCHYWFHFTCVGVKKEDDCVTREDVPFHCPHCRSSNGNCDRIHPNSLIDYAKRRAEEQKGTQLLQVTKEMPKYTCPKCPKMLVFKELQEHVKIAHKKKSTLTCLDCRRNNLYCCPATLSQAGDQSEMSKEYLFKNARLETWPNQDTAKARYYFCLSCESDKKNSEVDGNITVQKPAIKKREAEVKHASITKFKKIVGPNMVNLYTAEEFPSDGSEPIIYGLQPAELPQSEAKDQYFTCPVARCNHRTETLVILRKHLEDVHQY